MRYLIFLLLFFCCTLCGKSQNISGKWYGYAVQDTGELCTTCNFELDLSAKKSIWGQSNTYQKDTTDIRIALSGFIDKKNDTIYLNEDEYFVIKRKTLSFKWAPCLKQYYLKYQRDGNKEYLLGRGTGEKLDIDNKLTGELCTPAVFIFARSKDDLNGFMALHKDSLESLVMPPKAIPVKMKINNSTALLISNRETKKIAEIEVNHTNLEIQLRDYLKEDNDTVSLYLNRKLLASKKRISTKPLRVPFNITKGISNEVLIYAENLGLIPPNTSEMYIIDGKKSYRIMIESDLQKTAAVYLRYKPE